MWKVTFESNTGAKEIFKSKSQDEGFKFYKEVQEGLVVSGLKNWRIKLLQDKQEIDCFAR